LKQIQSLKYKENSKEMAINRDFASPSRNSKTKIRRPINAFLLYCNENRPQLKVENPGVKHVHISKILAIQWKRLQPERKNEYLEMARAIKESHGIANPGMKLPEKL